MTEKDKTTSQIKDHMMQAMVESTLTGHDLSFWQSVSNNNQHFQAVCRRCHQAALVSAAAAIMIPGPCPG